MQMGLISSYDVRLVDMRTNLRMEARSRVKVKNGIWSDSQTAKYFTWRKIIFITIIIIIIIKLFNSSHTKLIYRQFVSFTALLKETKNQGN